jgi:hypothetical protein
MSELGDFLSARGYLRVPLRRSGVGHFHTAGTLNGRPVEVLVDTGAACTVVALSVVRELGPSAEWIDGEAGGAGGALPPNQALEQTAGHESLVLTTARGGASLCWLGCQLAGAENVRNYDPSVAPDAASWLQLDESERVELAREYHRRRRIKLANLDAHAVTHAVIENQLAEGFAPAVNALQRLLAEGLDRHEAVHALGSVLMEHIWNLTNQPRGEGDPNAPYLVALGELTAASWRASG